MNREIIAVYDIEPEFASRFVSYLKSKYEERYDMYAFTELTALLEFVEKHRADMLIISQKSIESVDNPIVPDNLNVKRVVILSENCCDSYMDYKAVEKYRPADIVFREAVECAYEKKVETGEVKEHPTYKRIQEYVQEKYGFKVHTAYIAEVKRMVGLDMHKAPNAVEQRKHEYHPCPPEKVEAIKDALRHFGLISE